MEGEIECGIIVLQSEVQKACQKRSEHIQKQQKWQEGEQFFRQLAEIGAEIPSYWGNLGISLMMQDRYDEAEEALKQALAIDPDYSFARDNLKRLPEVRKGKKPVGIDIIIQTPEEQNVKQTLTIYEYNKSGVTSSTTVESNPQAITPRIESPLGQQPPRYRLFLNHYPDVSFTTCPRCRTKTQSRKFCLVVKVPPTHTVIFDKLCRHCYTCDLLIVDEHQLEDKLATKLTAVASEATLDDYRVIGTLDREEWNQAKQERLAFGQVVEYLHDFKEVVTFKRVTE